MYSTHFAHIHPGGKFHRGRDSDGSMLVWEKIDNKQAKCVEAHGRYQPRWIGVIDNFSVMATVWKV